MLPFTKTTHSIVFPFLITTIQLGWQSILHTHIVNHTRHNTGTVPPSPSSRRAPTWRQWTSADAPVCARLDRRIDFQSNIWSQCTRAFESSVFCLDATRARCTVQLVCSTHTHKSIIYQCRREECHHNRRTNNTQGSVNDWYVVMNVFMNLLS